MESGQQPPPPPPLEHSPRRELQLQGPRPTPLRVNKESHKIRKPPLPPPAARDPVIIYTISPKIIHVELADFMGLVQRLTGPSAGAATQALSPAAKLAAIQTASGMGRPIDIPLDVEFDQLEMMNRPAAIPGILSPVPSSLPPVSPGFFSPSSYLDPSFLGFLHDLSPAGLVGRRSSPSSASGVGGGGGGGGGGTLFVSPGKFLSSPMIPSPGSAFWDMFNHI